PGLASWRGPTSRAERRHAATVRTASREPRRRRVQSTESACGLFASDLDDAARMAHAEARCRLSGVPIANFAHVDDAHVAQIISPAEHRTVHEDVYLRRRRIGH